MFWTAHVLARLMLFESVYLRHFLSLSFTARFAVIIRMIEEFDQALFSSRFFNGSQHDETAARSMNRSPFALSGHRFRLSVEAFFSEPLTLFHQRDLFVVALDRLRALRSFEFARSFF